MEPIEPGWWWWRADSEDAWVPVEVTRDEATLLVWPPADPECSVALGLWHVGEWGGRCREPGVPSDRAHER